MQDFDYDSFISHDPLLGKRVVVHTSTFGNQFARVVSNEGVQGMGILYRLRFEESNREKVYADTNFRVVVE